VFRDGLINVELSGVLKMEAKTIESLSADIEELRTTLAEALVDIQNLMRHAIVAKTPARRQPYQRAYPKTPGQKAGTKTKDQEKKEELDKIAEEHREARLSASRIAKMPTFREFCAKRQQESPTPRSKEPERTGPRYGSEEYMAEMRAKREAMVAARAAASESNPLTNEPGQ